MSAPLTSLPVASDPLAADIGKLEHLIERTKERHTQLLIRNLELKAALRALVSAIDHDWPAFSKAFADAKALLANGDL